MTAALAAVAGLATMADDITGTASNVASAAAGDAEGFVILGALVCFAGILMLAIDRIAGDDQ